MLHRPLAPTTLYSNTLPPNNVGLSYTDPRHTGYLKRLIQQLLLPRLYLLYHQHLTCWLPLHKPLPQRLPQRLIQHPSFYDSFFYVTRSYHAVSFITYLLNTGYLNACSNKPGSTDYVSYHPSSSNTLAPYTPTTSTNGSLNA